MSNLLTGLTVRHRLQQLKNCDKQQFHVDIVQSEHYLSYHLYPRRQFPICSSHKDQILLRINQSEDTFVF